MGNLMMGASIALILCCAAFDIYRDAAVMEGIIRVADACTEAGHYDTGTVRIACTIQE